MAEALLSHMLRNVGIDGAVRVRSGGIAPHARDGSLLSIDMRMMLKEENISFSEDFRSADLKRHTGMVDDADLILTMTELQTSRIHQLRQDREAKGEIDSSYPKQQVLTLKEFIGEDGEIGDPEGEGDEAFKNCKETIEDCLKKAVPLIVPTNLR